MKLSLKAWLPNLTAPLSTLWRGVVGTALLQGIAWGFAFLTSIELASRLGANQYGTYAYLLSWVWVGKLGRDLRIRKVAREDVATSMVRREWPLAKGLLLVSLLGLAGLPPPRTAGRTDLDSFRRGWHLGRAGRG